MLLILPLFIVITSCESEGGNYHKKPILKDPFLTVLRGFAPDASDEEREQARKESAKFRKRMVYGTDDDDEIIRIQDRWRQRLWEIQDSRCVSCGRKIYGIGAECMNCAMRHPGKATLGWIKWLIGGK
jgi:hypothetical protein